MAGPGICVLCLADTCTSEVHPVFNPVAPYGYLLSDMYLFMAHITNPDLFVLSCRTLFGLDITRFCEQQHQPSSCEMSTTVCACAFFLPVYYVFTQLVKFAIIHF